MLLQTWLKCVIQASEPWISLDIDRGELWFSKILVSLSNAKFGIICLTPENKDQPWILFEAGAIAKGVSDNRVCTLLIDLKPTDVENPLAQFNHTLAYEKESMWELIKTINKELKDKSLPGQTLATVFETYWPQFTQQYKEIVKTESPKLNKRSSDDLMTEILSTIRGIDKQLRQVEQENQCIREGFKREKLNEYKRQIQLMDFEEEEERRMLEQLQEELTPLSDDCMEYPYN